ncbi:hypothetical protein MMC30_003286 [Trapelia coarctata]|nr:hypothetical protein [Trapelia coarctata]
MVSLSDVHLSNSRICTSLPQGLVAVFVGATSGIGLYTLKQFAKHVRQPRVYFVGRSQEAGDRIAAECKALNSEGEFTFVKADVSLISVVDDVCRDIKSKEKAVNLLFLSPGTLVSGKDSTEGLHIITALTFHSRVRFMINLLPLLQQATALRRVVTVFCAGKEGPVNPNDFQGRHLSILSGRGHLSALATLSLEAVAKKAPNMTFIHNMPGAVETGLLRGLKGASVLNTVLGVLSPLLFISSEESGERHLFLATSAKYATASTSGDAASGVPLPDGVAVAKGTNGVSGSGVYNIGADMESSGPKLEKLFVKFRKERMEEQVWKHADDEFKRITGPKEA